MIAPATKPLPKKGYQAINLARAGVANAEIARRLKLTLGTVHVYLSRAKALGHWMPPEGRNPLPFMPVQPPDGRSKGFMVRVSSDLFPDLVDEAKRRNRPIGTLLSLMLNAAVDRGLVADLLDND